VSPSPVNVPMVKTAVAQLSSYPHHGARDGVVGLGGQERDELEQLRRQLAEVAMERDAAARLLREAIKQ